MTVGRNLAYLTQNATGKAMEMAHFIEQGCLLLVADNACAHLHCNARKQTLLVPTRLPLMGQTAIHLVAAAELTPTGPGRPRRRHPRPTAAAPQVEARGLPIAAVGP